MTAQELFGDIVNIDQPRDGTETIAVHYRLTGHQTSDSYGIGAMPGFYFCTSSPEVAVQAVKRGVVVGGGSCWVYVMALGSGTEHPMHAADQALFEPAASSDEEKLSRYVKAAHEAGVRLRGGVPGQAEKKQIIPTLEAHQMHKGKPNLTEWGWVSAASRVVAKETEKKLRNARA